MFFGIILIVLALAIIFYHYIQGFFTSLFSAVIALVAAAVALNYYEPLSDLFKPTGFADQTRGVIMAALFGVTYIVLRVIFDWLIPGNVRLQSTIDKVGAVALGAVASIFCIGIIAISVQSLPFGPTILGFSRYRLVDHKDIAIAGMGDFQVNDVLQNNKLDPADRLSLLVPFDQWTLSAVGALSDGSLATDRTLDSIHPDLLKEEYADNLGFELTSRHSAWNYGDTPQVEVKAPEEAQSLREVDNELAGVRKVLPLPPDALPKSAKSDASRILLLIPCTLAAQAIEENGGSVVRISTGSVRLVTPDPKNPGSYVDNYPIGTADLHDGILFADTPDEPIFVDTPSGRGVAIFAFLIDRSQLLQDPSAKNPVIADGTFVEIKRLVRQDLGGQKITMADLPAPKAISTVAYRTRILQAAGVAPLPATPTANKPAPPRPSAPAGPPSEGLATGPLQIGQAKFSNELPMAVVSPGKGRFDANVMSAVKNHEFDGLTVHVSEPAAASDAANAVKRLYVPAGDKLVQVSVTPRGGPWAWAEKVTNWEAVDSNGKKYPINGAWGEAKTADGSVHLFGQYQSSRPLSSAIDAEPSATPTAIWLGFLVPEDANITRLDYDGKPYASVEVK